MPLFSGLKEGQAGRVVILVSKHYCRECDKYFTANTADIIARGSNYTYELVEVVQQLKTSGMSYAVLQQQLKYKLGVQLPVTTMCDMYYMDLLESYKSLKDLRQEIHIISEEEAKQYIKPKRRA